jgi:hypothetical protein
MQGEDTKKVILSVVCVALLAVTANAGTVGLWAINDGTGTTIADSSGNDNNAI